jgi:hypothetical protein
MQQSGSCPCGACSFQVDGQSIGRFVCHCTICQSVYKKPYADVTAFRANAVKAPSDNKMFFKRMRLPPAVNRGLCSNCNSPVVGFLSFLPGLRVALVPSANLSDRSELPERLAHIFYQSRVADVADSAPKISGYWRSEWAVGRKLIPSLLVASAKG